MLRVEIRRKGRKGEKEERKEERKEEGSQGKGERGRYSMAELNGSGGRVKGKEGVREGGGEDGGRYKAG